MSQGGAIDEAADGDRPQLRLRSRGPVLVLDVDGFRRTGAVPNAAASARAAASRDSVDVKNARRREVVVGFLNRRGLEVVELGEHELRELRVAARHMNVERGPGLTQKYL